MRECSPSPLFTSLYWFVVSGGVSTSGGRGFGLAAAGGGPGGGRSSIAGGRGATCWLTAAGGFETDGARGVAGGAACIGGASGGRGAMTGGFGGGAGSGSTAAEGGTAGVSEAGGWPRSMASNLRVSRSMTRTASQEERLVTSTLRVSAPGGPARNSWISGWLLPDPIAVELSVARTSAWSAGMS